MSWTGQSWTTRLLRTVANASGDRQPDVVGFGADGVWVATGNSDGGFQPPRLAIDNFGEQLGSWHVERHPRFVADVTGDGTADIVGFGDAGVWTALSNGDGTYRPAQFVINDLGYEAGGWRIDQHPRFVADLTGDGRADIIGFGSDGVWTALSNGDGSFQPPQFVLADFAPNANGWHLDRHPRFMADVTGDGRADIIGFGNDDVYVALSNGDGTFQPPVWAIGDLCYNQGWRIDQHSRFVADLTGDGRADIIGFGNDGVWTALSNADGSFQPPQFVLNDFAPNPAESALKHIFVLMLENRSFDHMLGFSGITGSDAETGQPTVIDGLTGTESNSFHDETFTVSADAKFRMPHDPGHSFDAQLIQFCGYGSEYPPGGPYPPIDNSGFATSYGLGVDRDPADAMRGFTETQLPFLHQLAREFVVCDRWFASHPGHTWPNRVFVHAATSGGMDMEPSYSDIANWMLNPFAGLELAHGTIYDRLNDAGHKYRLYAGDSFPMVATLDGISRTFDIDEFEDFAEDLHDSSFEAVRVIHIEPDYDTFNDFANGNSQHPDSDVRHGDLLIKKTYEAIRNSPLWEHSMLIITWDEHGGFYDHVAPPAAISPGDPQADDVTNHHKFAFDQLGGRVPAVVVSPLIPKNLVDHRVYDHTSVLATIERAYGLQPLTDRDLHAKSLTTLIRLNEARTDSPTRLETPAGYEIPSERTVMDQASLAAPADNGTLPGFLHSAVAQDLEISDPAQHDAIRARLQAIKTRSEAFGYMRDVATRMAAKRQQARDERDHVEQRLVARSAEYGTPAAAGAPTSCVIPGTGGSNIAYRDTSGRLHELWRDANGRTGTTDLTGNAGAPLAAHNPFALVDTARNIELLLYRGGDNGVHSLYWSTGPVGHDDLSGFAGAPTAIGQPVGYYFADGDAFHVAYRGDDGHLHELSWIGIAPVAYGGNLTATIGAPPAAGDPSGFITAAGTNIVCYRSDDSRILSVYWSDGPSGLDDLSGVAGTPPAVGDPSAYYTAHNDTSQIVYRATDDHLYELNWRGAAAVAGWNVTAAAGGPPAAGNPATYYSAGTNTKHIIYRSADGSLHELSWTPCGAPTHVDLTAFAAAPPAADDPTAFTINGPNTHHVAYRAHDNQIYEIRW